MLTVWSENLHHSFSPLDNGYLWPKHCSPTEIAFTEISLLCLHFQLYIISLLPWLPVCNNPVALFNCMINTPSFGSSEASLSNSQDHLFQDFFLHGLSFLHYLTAPVRSSPGAMWEHNKNSCWMTEWMEQWMGAFWVLTNNLLVSYCSDLCVLPFRRLLTDRDINIPHKCSHSFPLLNLPFFHQFALNHSSV